MICFLMISYVFFRHSINCYKGRAGGPILRTRSGSTREMWRNVRGEGRVTVTYTMIPHDTAALIPPPEHFFNHSVMLISRWSTIRSCILQSLWTQCPDRMMNIVTMVTPSLTTVILLPLAGLNYSHQCKFTNSLPAQRSMHLYETPPRLSWTIPHWGLVMCCWPRRPGTDWVLVRRNPLEWFQWATDDTLTSASTGQNSEK